MRLLYLTFRMFAGKHCGGSDRLQWNLHCVLSSDSFTETPVRRAFSSTEMFNVLYFRSVSRKVYVTLWYLVSLMDAHYVLAVLGLLGSTELI